MIRQGRTQRKGKIDFKKGQTLVELALILPLLVLVVFGLIETARMFQAFMTVQNAAREAARYGVTGQPLREECVALGYPDTNEGHKECRVEAIKDRARQLALGLSIDPGETNPAKPGYLGVQVRGQPCWACEAELDDPGIPGTRVEVTVFFNLPIIVPLFSSGLPALRVTGQTQMVNEGFQIGFGSEPPPTLEPAPTQVPLDSDGDGLSDDDERNIYGTRPDLWDTDGDCISDGDEVNVYHTNPLVADHWLDNDGDGLSNCDETSIYGTNPNLWDTDGDGLGDGAEVATHDTNPLAPDTDGDGLTDGQEVNTYHTNPTLRDTDGDGWSDGEEVANGWDPLDPNSPSYHPTPTFTPTLIPTPTHTPTPTPMPINIHEPLLAGDTYVAGTGQPGETVRIRDLTESGSPLLGTGVIGSNGNFRVDVSPPLVYDHLIYALTSTASDSATVVGDTPTPTPTNTPTPTPTPVNEPTLIIVSPANSCGPTGQDVNFTVSGSYWPTGTNSTVAFSWDGTDSVARSKTGYASATPSANGTFTASFTVAAQDVTAGTHNLYARRLYDPYFQDVNPFYVPCESAPTPTPTPTPILPADLIVQSIVVEPSGTITTTDSITITTVIKNDSTGPANELFWVDMYVNPSPAPPGLRQVGTDWAAVGSLGANQTIELTFRYWFITRGAHDIYIQVDTFNYISESNEYNNVSEPVTVDYQGSVSDPTPTPTAFTNAGQISGTCWIYIGGEWTIPSERVQLLLYKGTALIDSIYSDIDGTYIFDSVPPYTGYSVVGEVVVDNTLYSDTRTGVRVDPNQETQNVDLFLTPL